VCVERRGCSTTQMASSPLLYTLQCTALVPIVMMMVMMMMITPCFKNQGTKFATADVKLGRVDS